MPSFADSIFLFVLALLLFGPKRLPVLARELGKWVGEFRRASNEFKMQMEDELRASEQADRQKQIVAMEAAAPVPPKIEEAEPEHPHMRHQRSPAAGSSETPSGEPTIMPPSTSPSVVVLEETSPAAASDPSDGVRPLPIAVSGSLQMMPPSTGLPKPRTRNGSGPGHEGALGSLIDSLPEVAPESAHHGD